MDVGRIRSDVPWKTLTENWDKWKGICLAV